MEQIYTHDEAMQIVEIFEDLLADNGIKVPSQEDDDRDSDNDAALYGSTYDDMLTSIESRLIDMLRRHIPGSEIIPNVFSGTV